MAGMTDVAHGNSYRLAHTAYALVCPIHGDLGSAIGTFAAGPGAAPAFVLRGLRRATAARTSPRGVTNVGIGRDRIVRDNDTARSGEVATTADAHLDVRVGDRVRYRGTTRELRVGEVLEIIDERLVLIRRPTPASMNWQSLNGGVWPIKRSRIIEVVERR